MNKYKAAIFDIDGTLTPQVSWTAFTRDIGGSVAEHLAIYHDHLDGKIGLDESKARLLKMWQSTGKANKAHIVNAFGAWPVRPDAFPLIKWLKENGYRVCLITGSVGVYAKYMAEKLGADAYYANAELYFDANGELENFHYTTDQAEVKLRQFKEFCQQNNLRPGQCVPIGDSDNDIELFRITGNGILINEDEQVAEELLAAAWQTVRSLQEVQLLLKNETDQRKPQ